MEPRGRNERGARTRGVGLQRRQLRAGAPRRRLAAGLRRYAAAPSVVIILSVRPMITETPTVAMRSKGPTNLCVTTPTAGISTPHFTPATHSKKSQEGHVILGTHSAQVLSPQVQQGLRAVRGRS